MLELEDDDPVDVDVGVGDVVEPGVTVNGAVVADARLPPLTVSVNPVPGLFRVKPANVATPLVTDAVIGPLSVAPPGFEDKAMTTTAS